MPKRDGTWPKGKWPKTWSQKWWCSWSANIKLENSQNGMWCGKRKWNGNRWKNLGKQDLSSQEE